MFRTTTPAPDTTWDVLPSIEDAIEGRPHPVPQGFRLLQRLLHHRRAEKLEPYDARTDATLDSTFDCWSKRKV